MTVPVSPDGKDVPHNEQCASCKSYCTRLVQSGTYGLPPKPIYTCTHRSLCRDMMIFEHMIAQVRSA